MFLACLTTACSKMAWGVIGGEDAHDLHGHFGKPGNLGFVFHSQVTKPAVNSVSQNRFYARPVENQHNIQADTKQS